MPDQDWTRILQQNAPAIRQAQLAGGGFSPAIMREIDAARTLRNLTECIVPPSVRILKQVQDAEFQIRRLMEPTIVDALSEYVRHANVARNACASGMGQYILESQRALEAVSAAMRGFSVLADLSAITHGRLTELAKLPAMRSISDFVAENGYESAMAGTVAMGNVIARLYELEAGTATVEDVASEVEAVLDDPPLVAKRGRVATEGRIGLFLSILGIVLAIVSSCQSEVRFDRLEEIGARQHNAEIEHIEEGLQRQAVEISSRFGAIEARLIECMNVDKGLADEQTLYLVLRDVNLRDRPTTKGKKLGVLYPNQIVELVDKDKKWIMVKYFNHLEATEEVGWVSKKYLKIAIRRRAN